MQFKIIFEFKKNKWLKNYFLFCFAFFKNIFFDSKV